MKWLIESPWKSDISWVPFRIVWLLLSVLVFPALLSLLKIPFHLVPLCAAAIALPACIGTFGQLGIRPLEKKDVAVIFVSYIVIIVISAVLGKVWQTFLESAGYKFAERQQVINEIVDAGTWQRVFLYLSVCVCTPIIEEVLFRRLIFGIFKKGFRLPGIFITSIVFSAMHFFVLGIPTLFVMGLGFQLVYLYRKNLLTSMLLHSLVNTMAFIFSITGAGQGSLL